MSIHMETACCYEHLLTNQCMSMYFKSAPNVASIVQLTVLPNYKICLHILLIKSIESLKKQKNIIYFKASVRIASNLFSSHMKIPVSQVKLGNNGATHHEDITKVRYLNEEMSFILLYAELDEEEVGIGNRNEIQ